MQKMNKHTLLMTSLLSIKRKCKYVQFVVIFHLFTYEHPMILQNMRAKNQDEASSFLHC
jgi:hypothetical protein